MIKPLEGLTVLDFSQFLSGPSATLRLADLGARIIKIEHFEKGDITRNIYAPHLNIGDNSAFFQAINRGKESLCADLKNANDIELIKKIAAKVDIVVSNFRPGVMDRLGLNFENFKAINPKVIYAEINGYGSEGPWRDKPGQDLLLQAVSGATYLTGGNSDGPTPMGLAIADNLAGAQLVQGILAALMADEAMHVEVSMLEAMLDFQFEPLTLYYQDGEAIDRGDQNAAHALVAAPYGLYKTQDGYIALAMGAIPILGKLLDCDPLLSYEDPASWFAKRDEIKLIIASHLSTQTSRHWLSILEPADIWCAEVLDWKRLIAHEGFKALNMLQTVSSSDGDTYQTTRCPIRFDDQLLTSIKGAPKLGEHTPFITEEFQ
ncbi:CaiB/BaiF CoA transferase family protein [Hirschia maritima]|uniref:CaiB/BaiF CoA transferase family protein n=1 Tax=Hirschia maritima TaxID=1121961 RepID=UPI00035D4898|nr:CoA transferase [Hirschia maritima]